MGSATEVLEDRHDRWWSSTTVAVVTGGNKGIGLEIVRRLALEGFTVILTACDEIGELKSTQSLHAQGLQNVVFHILDVGYSESRAQFVEWIQKAYGGLDILVNNAAAKFHNDNVYETAVETMKIIYRGTMDLIEELLPLFKVSQAGARIVNISYWVGKLMNVNDEQVKKKLTDVTQFNQKFLDELEQEYLEACRAGNGEPNGYCNTAYRFSKILLNSYSRLLAVRLANQPDGRKTYLHNVHPGFVRNDIRKKLCQLLDEEMYEEEVTSGKLGLLGLALPLCSCFCSLCNELDFIMLNKQKFGQEGVINLEGGRHPSVAVSGAC